MELIIKISEELYERHKAYRDKYKLSEAIANGTPYNPSGDCISREALKKDISEKLCDKFDKWNTTITVSEFEAVAIDAIDNAQSVNNPKGDLISREALKEAFEDCTGDCACCIHNTNDFKYCGLIDNAPTVPQVTVFTENTDKKAIEDMKAELQNVLDSDRPQGEWVFVNPLQANDGGAYMCSNCKTGDYGVETYYKYCPFCGADMRKGGTE